MKAHRLALVAFLAIGLGRAAHGTAPPDSDAVLVELLEASGTRHLLEVLPAIVAESLEAQGADLPPVVLERARAAADLSFPVEVLRRRVVRRLRESQRDREAVSLRDWYRSPRGRLFRDLDRAARSEDTLPRLRQFTEVLRRVPPSRDRLDLARRQVMVTREGALLAMVGRTTAATSLILLNQRRPSPERLGASDLDDQIARIEDEMRPEVEQRVLLRALFLQRSLVLEDAEALVRDLETPPARAFFRALESAVEGSLRQATNDFSARVQAAPSTSEGPGS